MQILISDTNILIDLEVSGLIEKLFHLPYLFVVPDILFETELRQAHAHLLTLGLQKGELTSESMLYAYQLNEKYTQPSLNDLFALALAKQKSCPLLTDDLNLRKTAEKEAVVIKGTIWVVEQLVTHAVIEKTMAILAYDTMQQHNRRLPFDKAKQRLNDI